MFLQFKGNRTKKPQQNSFYLLNGPKLVQSIPRVHLSQGPKTEMSHIIFMFI